MYAERLTETQAAHTKERQVSMELHEEETCGWG